EAQDEDEAVAHASEDHYKPRGPDDLVPADPVSVAVALAEKLDILVGFWAIDEKPTGSKDPYALRRAALGIIRIVLDGKIRLALGKTLAASAELVADHIIDPDLDKQFRAAAELDASLGGDSRTDEVIDADIRRGSDDFGRSDEKTKLVLDDL